MLGASALNGPDLQFSKAVPIEPVIRASLAAEAHFHFRELLLFFVRTNHQAVN
jgi:hypothetical protein